MNTLHALFLLIVAILNVSRAAEDDVHVRTKRYFRRSSDSFCSNCKVEQTELPLTGYSTGDYSKCTTTTQLLDTVCANTGAKCVGYPGIKGECQTTSKRVNIDIQCEEKDGKTLTKPRPIQVYVSFKSCSCRKPSNRSWYMGGRKRYWG